MEYKFYRNNDTLDLTKINNKYNLKSIYDLYDLFDKCWTKDTCAPRLQKDWSESNKTLGQCSITSFIIKEMYGGEVYGIKLEDGAFHCYNKIKDCVFDLTSEQFGDTKLVYDLTNIQSEDMHFKDQNKLDRFNILKSKIYTLLNH